MSKKVRNFLLLTVFILVFLMIISFQIFNAGKRQFQQAQKTQLIEEINNDVGLFNDGAIKATFDAPSRKCFAKARDLFNQINADTCQGSLSKAHCSLSELNNSTLETLRIRSRDILELCIDFHDNT